jgi:hypothetical protein
MEEKKIISLQDIVEQLEFCGFKDEYGHQIERNVAFIRLKEIAGIE